MPAIPEFMLRRVYVKGSLRRTAEGLVFELHNSLASGTLIGVGEALVDGARYRPEAITFRRGAEWRKGDEVTSARPFFFQQGDTVTMEMRGAQPQGETCTLSLRFISDEAGTLAFTVSDSVRPDAKS